ncbi:UbiA family prenyltransferase [Streptomyces sp. ISL-99]|uniref:UbiA family prenyltransferase n=1 Tax=Streptomyces sp. ISL-99 TaxID=2819193 RepID=UPI001BE8E8B8|nr:UbiA family prenyltransferase [Streptomyces sp. ISL-99]MBT2530277.1 UbiA family prenyltransferase [Streptomyces sp. ISL-99]
MTAGARRLAAWAELLRVSALFTVPGDAVAGAASIGVRPNRGTALAVGASLCLYEAGMALNDWADRAEDAVDRPHRPIPSGRISPGAALAASGALTAAGLALAAGAGRRALGVATGLAATIWAYDLHVKHTAAAPAAMATARALDLLLGATATATATRAEARAERFVPHPAPSRRPHTPAGLDVAEIATPGAAGIQPRGCPEQPPLAHPARPAFEDRGPGQSPSRGGAAKCHSGKGRVGEVLRRTRPDLAVAVARAPGVRDALAAAGMLGAHTYAVTAVSRRETQGGSTAAPLAALAAAAVLATLAARKHPARRHPGRHRLLAARPDRRGLARSTLRSRELPSAPHKAIRVATRLATPATLAAIAYFRTAAKPLLHATLNPSPPLTQRAVGGGIRAMIPLQAALAARSGAVGAGAALMGLVPIARKLSRKVSPT